MTFVVANVWVQEHQAAALSRRVDTYTSMTGRDCRPAARAGRVVSPGPPTTTVVGTPSGVRSADPVAEPGRYRRRIVTLLQGCGGTGIW
ncbi:MAG: hypothetical protein M3300_04435 [Actinomycetota bacterium]|nr:hypothetical protein [Actinomycetota bacterium]